MGHGGKPDPEIESDQFQVPVPPREEVIRYWKYIHGPYLRPYFEKRSPIRDWPNDNAFSIRDMDNYSYGAVFLGIGGLLCRNLKLGKPVFYASMIAAPLHIYGTRKHQQKRSKFVLPVLTPLVMAAVFRAQWLASGNNKPLVLMVLSAYEVFMNSSSKIGWWYHYRKIDQLKKSIAVL